jgi:formylglycine-generating enzyme required for sulfatase activity
MRCRFVVFAVGLWASAGLPAAVPADAEFRALRRAVEDLTRTYPRTYGGEFLKRLERLEAQRGAAPADLEQQFQTLRREALLANPLVDFDRILLVRRGAKNLGLPQNWEGNQSIRPGVFDNEIAILSSPRGRPALRTLYRPTEDRFAGDLELHYDADRLMFSMRNSAKGPYRVYEIGVDGRGLREIPQIDEPDVHNYDATYLPNGRILFLSTAPFVGVPCVTGASHVANIFQLDPATAKIRRLTFEQEHDWCPTVLNDGRILYQRWEYSDLPHFVSRLLFHMDPDGIGQMEYYGSNSYWPNATFYARPVPNHPSRFVGIVGGHHGVPRMGELVLFDTAKGRREADGVVQRIPGWGQKVEPVIKDQLVDASWPKFLHPYPLSDKYFLVSAKPDPKADWGLYLVDVFDNMVLVHSEPGYAMLEAIPLRKTKRQPVIPDRVQPERKDALVFLQNVYSGNGLRGVPRGTVKQLRLFTYHFSYHAMGGQVNRVGLDGPWDIKRVMGTVPVEEDGSAYFRVPANTPISVQPLDAEGKAIQWMRSWLTAMPGETVSCVGCHDRQNAAPPARAAMAMRRSPSDIKPWYGPTRGFSFVREVQPVLNRYCLACHDGTRHAGAPDFRVREFVYPDVSERAYRYGSKFPPAYLELRKHVRPATQEPDMHALPPYEFHADTAKVVQLLAKGHYGVKLAAESWDRLITWIDLNAPAHGTWTEIVGTEKVNLQRDRRREMLKRYAGIDEDPEEIVETAAVKWTPEPVRAVETVKVRERAPVLQAAGATARRERSVDLGGGVSLRLCSVPGGRFRMGDAAGLADEQPAREVTVGDFWAGKFEVSNREYALFDSGHDSFLERSEFLHFSDPDRGWRVNEPAQPVSRVSWQQAVEFCRWLSGKTGERFRLPTEAEWEYAALAGSRGPMGYGDAARDFSLFANLADYLLHYPPGAGRYVPAWRPAMVEVNDGHRVAAPVGSYQPNVWGLHDMHGNVAEWTLSAYRPYPYAAGDGRNAVAAPGRKVVRGGSWYDRPEYARAAFRKAYHPWQGAFDVGFRVVSDGPVRVADAASTHR